MKEELRTEYLLNGYGYSFEVVDGNIENIQELGRKNRKHRMVQKI